MLTGVSVTEREVLPPTGEGDGVVEHVGPHWGCGVVYKSSHCIAVRAGEGVVGSCHLWRKQMNHFWPFISQYRKLEGERKC